MEAKRPIALWKGIVGTAVSGFLLVLIFVIFLLFYMLDKKLPDWTVIFFLVAFIIGMFTLAISIGNIREALEYKKQMEEIEKMHSKKNKNNSDEILHRLLAEGKITIEKYDELKK